MSERCFIAREGCTRSGGKREGATSATLDDALRLRMKVMKQRPESGTTFSEQHRWWSGEPDRFYAAT